MKFGQGKLKLTLAPDNIGQNKGLWPLDCRSGVAIKIGPGTDSKIVLAHLRGALDAIYRHVEWKIENYEKHQRGEIGIKTRL